MQAVVETSDYLRDAKAAGLTDEERDYIVTWVAAHPDAGDAMEGTGGARKIRFAGKGKGKSGGYRVITFYCGTDIPIFLLNVFTKNEKANLTPKERSHMRKMLHGIADAYKAGRNGT